MCALVCDESVWVSDATCECVSVTADVMGCCGEMSIGCALCVCVSNATRECGLIVPGCSNGGV